MVPLSQAKAQLSRIADEVHSTRERITITKNGRSYLVLMSSDDLESIEATLELLAHPDAVRRVNEARDDLDAGRVTSGDEMAELIAVRRRDGVA